MAVTPTIEQNTEIARRYLEEVFSDRKLNRLEELSREDVVNHDPTSDETLPPEEARGVEGLRRHVETAIAGFPDSRSTIVDMIAEDDTVVVRVAFEGTHDGMASGIEPTGNRVSVATIVIYRIEDGKIAERSQESDSFVVLRQLRGRELPAS